jgi:hypothetical protein
VLRILTLVFIAKISLSWKGLIRANTLAYFATLSVVKKKSLIASSTGANDIFQAFFFVADGGPK